MEKSITLKMLKSLPKRLLENMELTKNENHLKMLSKQIIQEYYYPDLRNDLADIFEDFNDSKYYFSNVTQNYQLTPKYELLISNCSNSITDKVASLVEKNLTKQSWTVNFYNKINSLICKLTYKEGIYFIRAFLFYESDESISKELAISRNYLQKIKKSCLVKMYLEFKTYVDSYLETIR